MKHSKKLKNNISDPIYRNISFFERVYEIVYLIPYGKVTTYGAIAKFLGTASSARMIGWALNNSHNVVPPVPAHRVVNRNGLLTGKMHFSTPTKMKELLEKEGILVKDDKIVNFLAYFWDPNIELV